MNTITKLFRQMTSHGKVTIVQKGFLYGDKVDTRREILTFRDFIILTRYLLKNEHLKISLEIKGKGNAYKLMEDLKSTGASVKIIRDEYSWLGAGTYEVDLLLYIGVQEEGVKKLIDEYYVIEDVPLVYPVGYISWEEYFKKNPHFV